MQDSIKGKEFPAINEPPPTESSRSDRVTVSTHIRPKLIRRDKIRERQDNLSVTVCLSEDNVDDVLEQARVQMENTTVGLRDDTSPSSFDKEEDLVGHLGVENHAVAFHSIKPKGILKQKRRYAPRPSSQSTSTEQRVQSELDGSATMQDDRDSLEENQAGMSFFKDNIVERPIQIPVSLSNDDRKDSTDGCRDKSASNIQGGEGKVVRSLSELVSLASNLHDMESSSSDIAKSETIEAHMEFSCMPKEEYDDLLKQAKSSGLPMTEYLESLQEDNKEGLYSKHNVDSDDDGDGTDQEEEDDGDDIFEFFGGALAEEEEQPPPPLRAFMVVWNAISRWITTDAVGLLKKYKNDMFVSEEPPLTVEVKIITPTDRTEISDICASRCASLMNMLKINLVRSLDELGYSTSDDYTRRLAETRLAEFVQKFDFAEPMVKFNSIQWRALTIILLNIVLPRHDLAYEGKTGIVFRDEVSHVLTLPNTLKEVGMSVEEYKYLVDTAIPSLDVGIG